MLSGQLPFPKIVQLFKGIIFARAARNYSALTPVIPDFFYPVAASARDNNEVNHVHLPRKLSSTPRIEWRAACMRDEGSSRNREKTQAIFLHAVSGLEATTQRCASRAPAASGAGRGVTVCPCSIDWVCYFSPRVSRLRHRGIPPLACLARSCSSMSPRKQGAPVDTYGQISRKHPA